VGIRPGNRPGRQSRGGDRGRRPARPALPPPRAAA